MNPGVSICTNFRALSGSGFMLYTNWGAKLERALIQFLLDLHSNEHGYTEVSPPFMVGPRLESLGEISLEGIAELASQFKASVTAMVLDTKI